ncbi:MAG TPA: hypothetical protein DCX06_06105, partial [Opitutae bacterium]|nr:hypothetical protein [Opitutae bacterium]
PDKAHLIDKDQKADQHQIEQNVLPSEETAALAFRLHRGKVEITLVRVLVVQLHDFRKYYLICGSAASKSRKLIFLTDAWTNRSTR